MLTSNRVYLQIVFAKFAKLEHIWFYKPKNYGKHMFDLVCFFLLYIINV